jgi:IS66 Orf2 like protein
MVRRGEAADRRREPQWAAAGVGDRAPLRHIDVAVVHLAPRMSAERVSTADNCRRCWLCRSRKRWVAIAMPVISTCSEARGNLIKILWHDGIGMSLYAKRLEKGRFIWPSPIVPSGRSARDGPTLHLFWSQRRASRSMLPLMELPNSARHAPTPSAAPDAPPGADLVGSRPHFCAGPALRMEGAGDTRGVRWRAPTLDLKNTHPRKTWTAGVCRSIGRGKRAHDSGSG